MAGAACIGRLWTPAGRPVVAGAGGAAGPGSEEFKPRGPGLRPATHACMRDASLSGRASSYTAPALPPSLGRPADRAEPADSYA